MTIYRLALSASLFLLSSCASQQTISFSEFAEQFQKEPIPKRIKFDYRPACNNQGECFVSEKRLNQASKVITKLNDAIESLVKTNNSKVDVIIHSEYANMKLRESINQLEKAHGKCELVSTIKQLALTGICAGLSLY